MQLIFKEVDGVKRLKGYSEFDYSTSSEEEILKDFDKSEVKDAVPSDKGDWKDNWKNIVLENESLSFDADYQPDETVKN